MFSNIIVVSTLDFMMNIRSSNIEHQIDVDLPRMHATVNERRILTRDELRSALNAISEGIYLSLAPLFTQVIMAEPLERLAGTLLEDPYAICDGGKPLKVDVSRTTGGSWELTAEKIMRVYPTQYKSYCAGLYVSIGSELDKMFVLVEELE